MMHRVMAIQLNKKPIKRYGGNLIMVNTFVILMLIGGKNINNYG